ncbi:unnamed protein product [Gadus morhua 'NCC']
MKNILGGVGARRLCRSDVSKPTLPTRTSRRPSVPWTSLAYSRYWWTCRIESVGTPGLRVGRAVWSLAVVLLKASAAAQSYPRLLGCLAAGDMLQVRTRQRAGQWSVLGAYVFISGIRVVLTVVISERTSVLLETLPWPDLLAAPGFVALRGMLTGSLPASGTSGDGVLWLCDGRRRQDMPGLQRRRRSSP